MSMTKALAKWIKSATPAAILAHRIALANEKESEKNPMIRSSLSTRIKMCDTALQQRGF